jgi:hypothetical protein
VKAAPFIFVFTSFARADSLDAVLTRMDQAAPKFRAMSTSFHATEYSAVFDEKKDEDGTFKMRKHAKTGVVLLADFAGRDERKMRIAGSQVEMYHPKAKSVDVYDTGKIIKSVDQFLLVGFGATRADLSKNYEIALGGAETIGGTKTTRLDLTPKSKEMKKLFNEIQIWIPDGQSNPIQEKVISGTDGKDYRLFQFSKVEIRTASDPAFPDSDFQLNLPPDTKRIPMK